jgi:septal ring factor EnvC (AmiA/AmiB activator)
MDGRSLTEARAAAIFAGLLAGSALLAAVTAGPDPAAAGGAGRTVGASAEARRQEEERLARVRREIEDLKRHLDRLDAREGSLVDTLDEVDLKAALLRREGTALEREIVVAEARQAANEAEAAEVGARIAATEAVLRRWLRDAYKAGPLRYLRLVAASSSPAQVASARRTIDALGLAEGRRLAGYRDDRRRLAETEARIEADRLVLLDLRADLERKTAETGQTRREKAALLADLRRRRASQKRMLIDLVQVEKDVRGLLESLARPGSEGPPGSLGFARRRGMLEWPARGRVAIPFGNVRHPRFGTEVPHPGVEIAAPEGQAVRAVFDGRVVYADWFRGYGQMLVIDHGDGYLSIYGHVDERLVSGGQMVRQGERIAHCGSGGSFEIPGLYFEIRHEGRPVDPAGWLRRDRVAQAAPGTPRSGTKGARPRPRGEENEP